MAKYTHNENHTMVQALGVQALELGLIDGNSRVQYHKGNASQGISAEIYVETLVDGRFVRQIRPQWVPKFTYKDGPTQIGKTLEVLVEAFYALIRLKG